VYSNISVKTDKIIVRSLIQSRRSWSIR